MSKEMKSVGEVDLNHCLREEFTRYIIEQLIDKRQSINLVGEKGTGKTRLLEDIRDCKLAGVKVILVDLKAHVNTYNGLLREIHRQLGLKEKMPGKLDRLFDSLEKEPVLYLVFLDNYDALLGNPDMDYKGYNVDFFNDLDFIKNKDNISLLCTTCKVHSSLPVYIDKKSYRNSWLTLEIENLPLLSRDQISGELDRQMDESNKMWFQANPGDKTLLLDCIHNKPFPYARLCFLVKEITKQTGDRQSPRFKKRLNRWIDEFNKENKISVEKKLTRWRNWLERKKIAAGIKKDLPIIKTLLAVLKKKCGL
jgi:hypothetical protein